MPEPWFISDLRGHRGAGVGPVRGRCGAPLGPSVPPGVGCLLGRQGPACYHTAVAEATEQRAARESSDRGWLRSSPRRSSPVQPPDRLDQAPLSQTSDTSQLLWPEGCRFESHSSASQPRADGRGLYFLHHQVLLYIQPKM